MNVTVVGASGGVGRHLVDQLLRGRHRVVAVARHPPTTGVVPVRLDLGAPDEDVLDAAVRDADAVLSALGPRTRADLGIAARGTASVVAAMHRAGTRRLVAVSAAPVAVLRTPARPDPPRADPGDGPLTRLVLSPVIRGVLHARYADLALLEDEVSSSGLEWTIMRPPRLTDAVPAARARTASGRNVRGGTSVSRAALATAMIDAIGDRASIGVTLGVAR